MAFIMRFWKSKTNCFVLFLSLVVLSCSGCRKAPGEQPFQIKNVDLGQEFKRLNVRISQQLSLNAEAIEAIENGVPLYINVDMELRDSFTLTLLAVDVLTYEIRYLPLSQHYQLEQLERDERPTYPRLRHVMSDLATIRHEFATGPLAPGEYELRVRTSLDQSSLPIPMQLPALLSDQWHHDSDWTQWPFKVSA